MLIDTDHADAVEPVRVADQHSFALGQHRIVGGVPTDVQALSDPGHGQVLHHQALQRPPQSPPRQSRPRLGRLGGVLAPHVPAAGAAVTADRYFKHGGSPAEWFMGEPAHHGVAHDALAATASTPLIRLHDPTGQNGPPGFESLSDHHQAEFVHAAERGQVRASEGSVSHVEVFQMGWSENPHPRETSTPTGRPTRRSRPHPNYTLDCEEPD